MIALGVTATLGLMSLIVIRWRYARLNRGAWMAAFYTYFLAQPEDAQLGLVPDFAAMTQVWPTWLIVAHFWVWDYRRFIVDQESLQKVLDFGRARVKVVGE